MHHVGLRGDATEQDARTPLQEKPWLFPEGPKPAGGCVSRSRIPSGLRSLMGGIVGSTLPPELASVTLAS